jgi:hypothetical protein
MGSRNDGEWAALWGTNGMLEFEQHLAHGKRRPGTIAGRVCTVTSEVSSVSH